MKKSIAILRGGNKDRTRSLQNGARAILALAKYNDEVRVLDVVIDEDNHWYERGIPSSPHKVFSQVDYYLDFTANDKAEYHNLAKKLAVKAIFNDEYLKSLNRVSLNRLLNQLNIATPKYEIVRNDDNVELSLKNIWNKFQLPIVIKEVKHTFNENSLLTYAYLEALKQIRKILERGSEVMIQEYADGKYISVALLPGYMEEENYTPTAIESINFRPYKPDWDKQKIDQKCLIGHDCEKNSFTFVDTELKKDIQDFAKNIQKTILANQYSMMDLALKQDKRTKKYSFKVLDIHLKPNLFEDSRFDFILKNSGVDLGRFIIDKLK